MSDHSNNLVGAAALGVFSVLATAAVEGRNRAQAYADAAATDSVVEEWYDTFNRQAASIACQATQIARHEETIEILRAELATARARLAGR